MVLHRRDHHFIARLHAPPAERVSDQVDALGRVSGEHDLASGGGIQERPDLPPRDLVGLGRDLAQEVHAPVHARAVAGQSIGDRVDHGPRLEHAGSAVQIRQRRAGRGRLRQRREVVPQGRGEQRHQRTSSAVRRAGNTSLYLPLDSGCR